MKKLLALLLLLLLLPACSGAPLEEPPAQSLPEGFSSQFLPEEPSAPFLPEDPDLALERLPDCPASELFAYYCSHDGAYSEGAMGEIMDRLAGDPAALLAALSGEEAQTQQRITAALGPALFWWGTAPEQDALYAARELELPEPSAALLEEIIAAYEDLSAAPS